MGTMVGGVDARGWRAVTTGPGRHQSWEKVTLSKCCGQIVSEMNDGDGGEKRTPCASSVWYQPKNEGDS